jgi:hypothetical protein
VMNVQGIHKYSHEKRTLKYAKVKI